MPFVDGVWVNGEARRQQSFAGAYTALAEICRVRPLATWPGSRTREPRRSTFRAPWGKSVQMLGNELRRVGAKGAILQVEIEERYFRIDGFPRADARQTGPGVILSFEHPIAGALMYPCDRFDSWQDNVHALALSLEALRAVDRYGVTKSAEQYRGWKALPASTDGPMDRDEAARVICAEAGLDPSKAELVRDNTFERKAAVLEALRNTHPDQGGKVEAFHRVQRARKALEGSA